MAYLKFTIVRLNIVIFFIYFGKKKFANVLQDTLKEEEEEDESALNLMTLAGQSVQDELESFRYLVVKARCKTQITTAGYLADIHPLAIRQKFT